MSYINNIEERNNAALPLRPLPNPILTNLPRDPLPDPVNDGQHSITFQELIQKHATEIHRFVISQVGRGADASDIAQQTLLQALANSNAFRGQNPRGWLYTIARHLIVDFFRDRSRVDWVSIDNAALQLNEEQLQSSSLWTRSSCAANERIQCCLDCIRSLLPPVEEVAVLLTNFHGFTDQESAERLGMRKTAFKFMLHRARRRMHAAAAREIQGNECPLVNKMGVDSACQGGVQGDASPLRTASRSRPKRDGGLDEAALCALQNELVLLLGVNQ